MATGKPFQKPAKEKIAVGVSTGSMADIAFLLLIFFLVTTTIQTDAGIPMLLPRKQQMEEHHLHERNVFNVLLNSADQLLVEEKSADPSQLRDLAKAFIANNRKDPNLSDSPQHAVISLKTDRGTSYESYVTVLDEIRAAYQELRAEHLGMSLGAYQAMLLAPGPQSQPLLDDARNAYPMQLSEATPSDSN